MTEREQKALIIAATSKVVQKGDAWIVPSQSKAGTYSVNLDSEAGSCTCPDFTLRQQPCKHIGATRLVIERERTVTETRDGEKTVTTVTEKVKVTYSQNWTAYNTAQQREKELFLQLLHDLCSGVTEPVQAMGRPRLSYQDMIFATAFKVYSTVSGRRFTSDLQQACANGYITKAAHFNSVLRYLDNPALTSILRELITYSSLPLKSIETDFAVDSSGFSTCQYVRWFNAKYGKEQDNHDWIKMHLMTGVVTNIVTSVEITGRHDHDGPFLPALVESTANNFVLNEVSADKGYSSRENHEAIERNGATAYIAFKKNATGGVGGIYEKMFHYFSFNREEFLTKYHKRSNVETTFSMIKAKFGSSLRGKNKTAQINEALCKVLCHNICVLIQSMFEFGITPTFGAESKAASNVG